jgi:hypothetical protein
VLDEVAVELAADPRVSHYLLDKPEIFGWNNISIWAVVVRMSVKVMAGKQGEVARTQRQRTLEAFRQAGIAVETSKGQFIQNWETFSKVTAKSKSGSSHQSFVLHPQN